MRVLKIVPNIVVRITKQWYDRRFICCCLRSPSSVAFVVGGVQIVNSDLARPARRMPRIPQMSPLTMRRYSLYRIIADIRMTMGILYER